MATAYTPILKLALPVTGELAGTWGTVVNDNITSMVEQAVAGLATINTWVANSHTLTTADGTTSESRCAMLVIDDDGAGNPSAAATVICPAATKPYIVQNICGQTVTVKTSAGTGVAIPNNQSALVFCNGTNVVTGAFNGDVVGPSSATDTAIAIFDGTTGKLIKNTGVTIDGSNNVSGVVQLNATTLDATNLEVTNLKAKDGTAAGSIADSTGVVTLASSVLTTTDINGGTVDNTAIGATTASTVRATQVDIIAQGDLRLQDTTGGEFVALQAPGTLATSYTLTLPVDDGTSGQALITDGSGVLSWSSAASGDVYGPASATDNAIARYDGTTGKLIQNSVVTIADTTGNMAGVGTISAGAITSSALTSGRVSYAGTAGLIRDLAGFTFDGATLTSPAVSITSTVDPALTVVGGVLIGSASSSSGTKIVSGLNWNFSPVNIVRSASNVATPRLFALPLAGDNLASTTIGEYNAIWGVYDSAPTAGSTSSALNGGMIYGAYASHRWFINGTERMRIASTGTISLGAAPGAESLRVTPVASAVNYLEVQGATTGNRLGLIASGSDANIGLTYNAKGSGLHVFGGQSAAIQFVVSPTASAVNYLQVTGSATGGLPNLSAQGSDANINIWYYAKGTGGHGFATNNTTQFFIAHTASAVNYLTVSGAATSGGPYILSQGSDANINVLIATKGTGAILFRSNTGGNDQFRVSPTASAVNYLQVTGGATGNGAVLSAQGSDADIAVIYRNKGTGVHFFQTSNLNQFVITHQAAAVNYAGVQGSTTGSAPLFYVQGSDTNIDLSLVPKGTGVLRFGTYTAGILAQAGYITIKDAAGNTRNLLVG